MTEYSYGDFFFLEIKGKIQLLGDQRILNNIWAVEFTVKFLMHIYQKEK